jgi:hypothetical protein
LENVEGYDKNSKSDKTEGAEKTQYNCEDGRGEADYQSQCSDH